MDRWEGAGTREFGKRPGRRSVTDSETSDPGSSLAEPTAEGIERRQVLALVGAGMVARLTSTILAALAGFATTSLLVRLLGTSGYGVLAVGLALVGLVGVAARLGLGVATVRKIAALRASGDRTGIEQTARGVTTLMISLALVGSALVAGLMYFTQRGYDTATALLMGAGLGLLLLGRNTATAGQAIAQGMGRMLLMEVPGLILVFLQLLVAIILTVLRIADIDSLALGFGAAGLLCVVITGGVIQRILSGVKDLFRPAPRGAVELIVMAGPYAVAAITTQIISQFDVLVLGLTHSEGVVGAYASTLRIASGLLLLMPGILTAAYVPAATVMFTRDDLAGFRDLYIFVSKVAYLGSLPIILALMAFPEVVFRAFFGAHYPAARGIIWILLVGHVVNLTFGLNSQALIATGQRRRLAKVYVIALISMIGLAVALIPLFGGIGAALSTTLSFMVLNVGVGVALYRSAGVSPFRSDMVALLSTSLLPAVLALLMRQVAVQPSVLLVLVVSVGLWSLWFGIVLGIRAVRVKELLQLIPSRRAR